MTSVRQLKIVADAGEPDDVLSLRIDVIKAAIEWHDSNGAEPKAAKLAAVVRRYKRAVKQRRNPVECMYCGNGRRTTHETGCPLAR